MLAEHFKPLKGRGVPPFPDSSHRIFWEKYRERLLEGRTGEELLNYQWPHLTAGLFREYQINGNRTNYEKIHFSRRKQLLNLILHQIAYPDEKILNEIANALWLICEESFWGVPAHNLVQGEEEPDLPDPFEPYIDLFAAETGSLLAWAMYLLKEDFNQFSPLLVKRVERELNYRIIEPFLERDDFWWMGYKMKPEQRVCNWNPWILSNIASILMLTDYNLEKINDCVERICLIADNFIGEYGNDGGCDEGPHYWGVAGASLFDLLEIFYYMTEGRFNIYTEPLIINIGTYICKMHIHNDYFVNFADSSPKLPHIPGNLIYRFGKKIESMEMISFGLLIEKLQKDKPGREENHEKIFRKLFCLTDSEEFNKNEFKPAQQNWLPDIEVMTARSGRIFLACKGGHNNENHNHNDTGSFLVYLNNAPLIIDIGVETYTAKTFSSKRYEIWTMQSEYHNLPLINGFGQSDGQEYRATETKYILSEETASLSMCLTHAYPEESGIVYWKRQVELNRNEEVLTIREDFKTELNNNKLVLMTAEKPEILSEYSIILKSLNDVNDDPGDKAQVTFSRKCLWEIENISINDSRLRESWPETIYRLIISPIDLESTDFLTYTIKPMGD